MSVARKFNGLFFYNFAFFPAEGERIRDPYGEMTEPEIDWNKKGT
jgi:hypothetical protein